MKFEKGHTPWNKGLTSKDDQRVKNVAMMKIKTIKELLKTTKFSKEDKFEKTCLCGCGQKIIPQKWHFRGKNKNKKIQYIHGHNTKGKKMVYCEKAIQKKRIMGKELNERNKKNKNYIKNKLKMYQHMRDRPPEEHLLYNKPVPKERTEKRLNTIKERYGKLVPPNKGKTYEKMYGKKRAKQMKEEISSRGKGKRHSPKTEFGKLEKHPSWLGGISFEPYGIDFNKKLKRRIRERDDYLCQNCGKKELSLKKVLSVHHIDYDKQNNCEYNLISLCPNCHTQTNNQREIWKKRFKYLILIIYLHKVYNLNKMEVI